MIKKATKPATTASLVIPELSIVARRLKARKEARTVAKAEK